MSTRKNAAKIAFAVVCALAVVGAGAFAWVEWRHSAEIALGRQIYAEACASCHGVDLEGQPDWQQPLPSGRMPAPPHDATGHTWHHPDAELFAITKGGLEAVVSGYESDMPAFAGTLSDEEIRAVLAFIKSTWPEREREYQAARTRERQ